MLVCPGASTTDVFTAVIIPVVGSPYLFNCHLVNATFNYNHVQFTSKGYSPLCYYQLIGKLSFSSFQCDNMTLSITIKKRDTQHCNTPHLVSLCLVIVMLSVVLLDVVTLRVVRPLGTASITWFITHRNICVDYFTAEVEP